MPCRTDDRLAQLYYALGLLKVETGAFSQLTREYMENTFNPNTPDVDDVRYVNLATTKQERSEKKREEGKQIIKRGATQ